MSRSCLEGLPTEVLFYIISPFCHHCRRLHQPPADYIGTPQQYRQWHHSREQQDPAHESWYLSKRRELLLLCLVSKRLREVAQPILYHEFALGYGDSWRSEQYTRERRLISFLSTISERPSLASAVKHIFIRQDVWKALDIGEVKAALVQSGNALGIDLNEAYENRILLHSDPPHNQIGPSISAKYLREFLKSDVGNSQDPELKKAFHNKNNLGWRIMAAEIFSMLVAQLPNLEQFGFQGIHSFDGVSELFQSAFVALGLSNPGITAAECDFMSPCFGVFENLQVLHLNQHGFGGTINPVFPALKVLRATDADWTASQLQLMLQACTGGLQTFVYEARQRSYAASCTLDDPYEAGDYHFTPADMMTWLLRHKDSLKGLHVDLRKRAVYEDIYASSPDRFFSLKKFTALETLLLSANMILAPATGLDDDDEPVPLEPTLPEDQALEQRLPDNVVNLHMVHHVSLGMRPLESALAGLAKARLATQGRFPKLQLVTRDEVRIIGMKSSLGGLFNDSGVKFQSQDWALGPDELFATNEVVHRPLYDSDDGDL